MHRLDHIAFILGCALALLVLVGSPMASQGTGTQTADVLARMRVDLTAKRYAAVIAGANGLLESTRTITTPERVVLWQLLAAAYYPEAPSEQQPDSAGLPIEALIRIEPDIKIARELSWPGLDELTERTRAQVFAIASRPLGEYSLSAITSGRIAVVASRPTRFRLISVDDAGGRTAVHDSSTFVTATTLQLRTHDALGPIFTDGVHELHLWAYDSVTGDSVRVAHRALAQRSDLSPPAIEPNTSPTVSASLPTAQPVAPATAAKGRSSMLWGGLALAVATAVLAQEARPDDGLRSTFRVDARAFVVGGAMATAAVTNFFIRRAPSRLAASPSIAAASPPPRPAPMATYRVLLVIDPPER